MDSLLLVVDASAAVEQPVPSASLSEKCASERGAIGNEVHLEGEELK